MGGLRPSFTKLAIAEAIDLGLTIKCAHISGVNNQESDYWSRTPDKHNWMLHPQLFRDIDKLWGPHTIDRFASCQNCHLRRFNSRYWEPLSKAVDALSQVNWHLENNFVNAPFCLLHKVLDVVQTQKAYATVIAPKWLGQTWYHRLVKMSICPPLRLPNNPRVCQSMGVAEPCRNRKWALYAWRIYGGTNLSSRVGH